MSDRVGIRDSRFAGQWHREERREVYRDLDRIFTVCGSPIDEDVLESHTVNLSDPTCPVCWAKRLARSEPAMRTGRGGPRSTPDGSASV